jgi:hypothetical protein
MALVICDMSMSRGDTPCFVVTHHEPSTVGSAISLERTGTLATSAATHLRFRASARCTAPPPGCVPHVGAGRPAADLPGVDDAAES